MVFGPVLDAMAARREGTTAVHVLARGNRLVAVLPLRVRVAFWLSNLPYWALLAALVQHPLEVGAVTHAVAAAVVASASTAYHGVVLFGGEPLRSWLAPKLLLLDIMAANSYGLALALHRGMRVVPPFVLPLCALALSARFKRSDRPRLYAAFHGAWHVASAWALFHCLNLPLTEVQAGTFSTLGT